MSESLKKIRCHDGNINYDAYLVMNDVSGWGYVAYLPNQDSKSGCLMMVNKSNIVTSFVNLSDEDNSRIKAFIGWYYTDVPDWDNVSNDLPF